MVIFISQSVEIHLAHTNSDHCINKHVNGDRPSRFEDYWLKDASFRKVIGRSWDEVMAISATEVVGKLNHCHDTHHLWKYDGLSKLQSYIKLKKRGLQGLL